MVTLTSEDGKFIHDIQAMQGCLYLEHIILAIQWSPSKPATLGTSESVLIIGGVVTFQG